MPRTLKCGHVVPSEPDEVSLETLTYNDGTRHYFIRTHKNSIRLTEDQARFIEKALFDELPYLVDLETEYGDENPGVTPPTFVESIPEKDWDTQDEFMDAVDEVLKDDPDPAIMRAFNAHRDGGRSE